MFRVLIVLALAFVTCQAEAGPLRKRRDRRKVEKPAVVKVVDDLPPMLPVPRPLSEVQQLEAERLARLNRILDRLAASGIKPGPVQVRSEPIAIKSPPPASGRSELSRPLHLELKKIPIWEFYAHSVGDGGGDLDPWHDHFNIVLDSSEDYRDAIEAADLLLKRHPEERKLIQRAKDQIQSMYDFHRQMSGEDDEPAQMAEVFTVDRNGTLFNKNGVAVPWRPFFLPKLGDGKPPEPVESVSLTK